MPISNKETMQDMKQKFSAMPTNSHHKNDEWSGFADLLANLIEKYAAVLDIENLPEPSICLDSEKKEIVNKSKLFAESIEKNGHCMI